MNEFSDPTDPTVTFDVVIRGSAEPDAVPTVDTIDEFRPSPHRIEKVRRWFVDHGCRCSITEFGLVCSLSRSTMEEVFGVEAAHPETRMLPVPEPVAAEIGMITVSQRPELF